MPHLPAIPRKASGVPSPAREAQPAFWAGEDPGCAAAATSAAISAADSSSPPRVANDPSRPCELPHENKMFPFRSSLA